MVIVNDFSRSHVPAVGPVVAARGFTTLADRNSGYVSLRSGTLFLIVGIHAALFCGLITPLSHTRGLAAPPNSQNHVLNSVPPEIEIAGFLPAK
jgi:hypothetical protein